MQNMYGEGTTGPLDQPGPYKAPPGFIRRHVDTFLKNFFGAIAFWVGISIVYGPSLIALWLFVPDAFYSIVTWMKTPFGNQPTWQLLVAFVIILHAMKE